MHAFNRYNKRKMQVFDPKARGNSADAGNGCQMMNYSHVKKYLKRNEYLNLNLG